MQTKRYRIVKGVLTFEPHVKVFDDYLYIPYGVKSIDFNNVEHIRKPLNLGHFPKGSRFDFKNVKTASTIYFPDRAHIKEDFYWVDEVHVTHSPSQETKSLFVESSRMADLGVYEFRGHPTLIYLSGTVGYGRGNHKETLELRSQQKAKLMNAGYYVYSPGNHVTMGDEFADNSPHHVAEIDLKALDKADVIVFDLNYLSAGTCAELGYTMGSKWYESKELYYMYTPTKNFFINGLLKYMTRIADLDELIMRGRNL